MKGIDLEQRHTDADRGDKGCLVLFSSEQEDCEHEERGEEHFDKQPLCDRGAASKLSSYVPG